MPALLRSAWLEHLPGVKMAAKKQVSPAGPPTTQQAAETSDAGAPRVRLTVEGGAPGEQYQFRFEISAGGALAYRLKSELAGRLVEDSVSRVEPAEFDRLLRGLTVGRLKQARQRRAPPIPPCSVLGLLEVFDGRERVEMVFMADPEQARQAGHRTPPVVARAVGRIYTLAARQMGLKSPAAIRP